MNEPLYKFVTRGNFTPSEVFTFHNEATDAIRSHNSDVLIGGYCSAFPNFEENDFQRWHDRWKRFMEMSGDRMDFWSIHTYDFNLSWSNTAVLRRGSNIEATFDMLEHYSHLLFGEVKPFVISEYGGRALTMEADPWSPLRDWLTMKSMTSMLLSFAERPQHILSAIPFIIVKAEWGRQADGDPYPWRLMRQNHELPGQTGNHWVYTELVKFYQLWSDINGTRIDSESTDPDIQVNAYADGNKLYLILNNLYFNDTTVQLNIKEQYGNLVQKIRIKHLYLDSDSQTPVLNESNVSVLDSIVIGAEGSIVIEYTFVEDIVIDQTIHETKFYADEHLTPIFPNSIYPFHINGVLPDTYGHAILRLGLGRSHEASLTPEIRFNGHDIKVPQNYMGYDQRTRQTWFGIRDIPIPFAYIQPENLVTVQFSDKGGHISSMALRVFNSSDPIKRSNHIELTQLTLEPSFVQMETSDTYILFPTIIPQNSSIDAFTWSSSDEEVASVNSLGEVLAISLGQTLITVSNVDGTILATSTIEVVDSAAPIAVTGLKIIPASFILETGKTFQMEAEILPGNASNQLVEWNSTDTDIATVDSSGKLKTLAEGKVKIIITTDDGKFRDTSQLQVVNFLPTFVKCELLPVELESNTEYDVQVEYSAGYQFDLAVELKDPNDRWVGEGRVTIDPGIGIATIKIRNVSTTDWTTPVFPEPGTGYALRAWIRSVGGDWTTNSGGCSQFDITIKPQSTAVIPAELRNYNIFPNPTSGHVFLELPRLEKEANVTVFDLLGYNVWQDMIHQKRTLINLKSRMPGLYLIHISNEKGSIAKRVILN